MVNLNENFFGLVGESPQMKQVRAIIRQVARADITVLITGESGTGKENLLKWFRNNMKYASKFDFMKRRDEQINECTEAKIACEWLMGSKITNSGKGYIVTFKDNEFTIDEFPAGREPEYNITDKDIFFKKK